MNLKATISKEIQQFFNNLSFNFGKLLLLLGIYLFFIYRYVLIYDHSLSGNIVTFLRITGEHTLTDSLLLNITSLLFYLLPLLYMGKSWTLFMKTSNPLFKIRQHFSAQHIFIGELLWILVGYIWFEINQFIYSALSIPFSAHQQWIYFILLFAIISNILLLFACHNADLIGWIIIILTMLLLVAYPLSITILGLIFVILLLGNIYCLKHCEVI